MTIVVGFPGKGYLDQQRNWFPDRPYVVLAADSEEGNDLIKSSARKVVTIDKGNCKCILAGSGGDGDFIDAAIQEIGETITEPYSLGSLRAQMKDVVTRIHLEDVDTYHEDDRQDHEFRLLAGIWVKDEGVQLVGLKRSLCVIQDRPSAIGIGLYLARYLIDTYHFPNLPLYHATRLAIYLLAEVKKYASGCSGPTQLVWVEGNGRSEEYLPDSITAHEKAASVVTGAAKLLLHFAEPWGWQGNFERIDAQVDTIASQMKSDFRRLWQSAFPTPSPENLQAIGKALAASAPPKDPSPSTPDPLDRPPSQGSGESH